MGAQVFLPGILCLLCGFAWVLSWTLLHSALVFLWLLDNFEASPVTSLLSHVLGYCQVKSERSRPGEECVAALAAQSLPWD